MKFTCSEAKKVRIGKGKYITFTGKSVYETTDKAVIEILSHAKNVNKATTK